MEFFATNTRFHYVLREREMEKCSMHLKTIYSDSYTP